MLTNSFQPGILGHKISQTKNIINKSAIQNYKQSQTNPPKLKRKSSVSSKKSHCNIPKKTEQNSSRPDNPHHARKRSDIPNSKYSSLIIGDKSISTNNEEKKSHSSRKNKSSLYDTDNDTTNNTISPNYKMENEKLNKTVQMLLHCIKTISSQVKGIIQKQLKKSNDIIKELRFKNEFLIKENTNLKKKILEFYFISKQFDLSEIKHRNQLNKCLNNLFIENIYLRKSNLSTASISMDLVSKYNKTVQDRLDKKNSKEEQKEDANKNNINSITNTNNNNNENNPFVNLNKEQNNPFIRSYSNEKLAPRVKHKRQRTHIKLNNMNSDESNGQNTIIVSSFTSSSSSNSVNEDKKDAFGKTMNSFGFLNKTLKRNDCSRKNVLEDITGINNIIPNKIGNNRGYTSPNNSQNFSNNKKPQLFYRTPRGKDKQKIEFTK